MRNDGTDIKVLRTTMGGWIGGINWHPSGKKIVYSRSTASVAEKFEIFIYDLLTNTSVQLTFNSQNEYHPDFSPDGSKIIFISEDSTYNMQLFIMDSNGENIRQITHDYKNSVGPNWCPEGNKILFSQQDEENDYELFILNLHNGSILKLTNNLYHDIHASWSNDGKWIVYIRCSYEGCSESSIYIIHPDGSNEQLLRQGGYTPDLFIKY